MTRLQHGGTPQPSVAVAIVCICGAEHLARCLDALRAQQGAPAFQVVVRYDPALPGMETVIRDYPEAQIACTAGQRTPLALAAAALRACDADVLLLTEDHCVPRHDWVRTMVAARASGRAAIGGRVEIRPGAPAVDWAFYFVDFFRYAAPVNAGRSPTLTVCNVAYDRRQLAAIGSLWAEQFDEPAVHNELRARFGELWLLPDSEVSMRRTVSLRAALYERYAFGRIFGHRRVTSVSATRRWLYSGLAPALPALLLARMAAKALRSRALAQQFVRAVLPVVAMVLCWSWGEWLGYATARPPRRLVLAPEVASAARARQERRFANGA